MNTIKGLLFVLMILASGFMVIVLWAVATKLFAWGVYDLGVAAMVIAILVIVCNITIICLEDDARWPD